MGKDIAKWLEIENWAEFTTHTFRRSGATILGGKNVSVMLLKQAGSWKSDSSPQNYINESDGPKQAIASALCFSQQGKRAREFLPPSMVAPLRRNVYVVNSAQFSISSHLAMSFPIDAIVFSPMTCLPTDRIPVLGFF
jgi:hypothetical protein